MKLEDLKNPELQEKLRACETPEEVFALAKEQGLELSASELEAISGGWDRTRINDRPDPTIHL